MLERSVAVDEIGTLAPSSERLGFIVRDRAKVQLDSLIEEGYDGAVFIGGARMTTKVLHLGDWSEILKWRPLLEGTGVNQRNST